MDTNAPRMNVLNKYDIIGCTFLMPPQEYGQNFRVLIVKIIDCHEKKLAQEPGNTQFTCSVIDDQ